MKNKELWWSLGLFGLAFVIRLVYALQIPFPPLDDPAYYVQGARSLFSDQPFQLNIAWNYFPRPTGLPQPAFDFWMPLTSVLIAICFLIFGDNPLAAQLPSVLAGASLAVLTFWLALQMLGHQKLWLSGLAGLYIALNPLLAYQSAVPDSQMIYAALVAGALLIWLKLDSNLKAVGLGLLIGVAYLTRSHAILLAASWGLYTIWQLWHSSTRQKHLIQAGFVLLGIGVTTGPWLLRNLLTFGYVNSPAGLQSALIYNYPTLFNYETPINFASFQALGLGRIVEARFIALNNAWNEVLGVMFFPTVFLPVLGLFLLWRHNRTITPALLYGLVLSLGLPIVFVAASATGSFYHSSASLAPMLAIGYIYLLWQASVGYKKWRKRSPSLFPVLILVIFGLLFYQFWVAIGFTVANHQRNEAVYNRLKTWFANVDPKQNVITDQPSTFNYATNLPALRLPSDEPLEVLQRLAKRYNARYIVTTLPFGRYPKLLQTNTSENFTLIYRDPQGDFEIYEVTF